MSDPSPSPPPPTPRRFWRRLIFVLSLLMNLALLVALAWVLIAGSPLLPDPDAPLKESHLAGKRKSKNKVAVIRIEGILFEGSLGYYRRQIDAAANDPRVKAIVLRINSPGGTISASEEILRRLKDLRDGKGRYEGKPARPMIVSMGTLAASGGYYISMAGGTRILVEPTTLTGSIGVFAAFPNVEKMGEKLGFKVEVVKRGAVKDGGSPFKTMTVEERLVWEALVDEAYERFLAVIAQHRPQLTRALLLKSEILTLQRDGRDVAYNRQRADGGIFTAKQALRLQLADAEGLLEDAIKESAAAANLGDDWQAVQYRRPRSLLENLLGIRAREPAAGLRPERLASGLMPRLWYLAPQSELAGLAATLEDDE